MADTYTLISSVTVGAGGASSIDFTSIPSTYTDLVVKVSTRAAVSATFVYGGIRFNSDTNTYDTRTLFGSGSSAFSTSASTNFGYALESSAANATANTFGNAEIYIPNYAGSTKKSYSTDQVSETNATATEMALGAGLWSQTGAITSITLYPGSGSTFVQYSTAYLYGIKSV